MTKGCVATSESLRASSPSRGGDRCSPATADHGDANRPHDTIVAVAQGIRNPAEEAKSAALRAPTRIKRVTGGPTDVLRALENRHRWLLFAQHCYTCSRAEEACELGKLCTYGKKTLKHVAQCKRDDCPYPRCRLLRPLLQHSRKCQSSTCAICVPVWNYIQKDLQQQQQQGEHLVQVIAQNEATQVAAQGDLPAASWSPALTSLGGVAASAASLLPDLPPAGGQSGADKGEGGASIPGAGRSAAGNGTGPGADGGCEGRLSYTGAGVAVNGAAGSQGADGDAGGGGKPGIAVMARGSVGCSRMDSTPGAQQQQLLDQRHQLQNQQQPQQQHQQQQQQRQQQQPQEQQQPHPAFKAAAAIAASPAAGQQRYVGMPSGALSPYALPPYTSGLAAALGGQLDGVERLKGVTITATPSQPISVANRGSVQPSPSSAGQPQLVHVYPSPPSIGAYFPHLQHPHPPPPASSAAAVTTHWLPLQGLAPMPSAANGPAVASTNGSAGGAAGGSLLATNGAAANGAAGSGLLATNGAAGTASGMWHSPAAIRPGGPVAFYGIAPDAVRPGSLGAVASPVAMPAAERYGHPYTISTVNGGGGMPNAGTLTMAAAPLLLWSAGHGQPGTHPPVGVSAPGHVPPHLAASYSVAQASGSRSSAAAAAGAASGNPAPAMLSPSHVTPHALLYGHTGLGPGGTGGGGAAGSAGGGLTTEMATGAALWSYVLR